MNMAISQIFDVTLVKTRYFKRVTYGTSAIAAAETGHRISFPLVQFGHNGSTSWLGALEKHLRTQTFTKASNLKLNTIFLLFFVIWPLT